MCDLYVRISTFVARETNNDRFTIPERVLPIASKRQVTHYPRVAWEKKNKQSQWPQPLTKQTRCSYKLKRIHICGIHLGLLPQTSSSGLRLWIILVFSISISTCSGKALALGWHWSLSLSLLLCLHVQFPRYRCTSSILWLAWLVRGLCLHI